MFFSFPPLSLSLSFLFQDLIIFPDDCEFKRVSQCTTGRVYVLKFKAGSKRLFFWMQVRGRKRDSLCECKTSVSVYVQADGWFNRWKLKWEAVRVMSREEERLLQSCYQGVHGCNQCICQTATHLIFIPISSFSIHLLHCGGIFFKTKKQGYIIM